MRAASVVSLAVLAATLALTACAPLPVTRVIMLPQPGHNSVVEVTSRIPASAGKTTAPRTTLLTRPYRVVDASTRNRISEEQWDAARVKDHYSVLLAAWSSTTFLLYFEFNGTQLTPESAAQLDNVITQAMARPGNEIVVTGHTDMVGSTQANDQLSLHRAQVIRQAIIERGFDPARIYAVGRGARDPLVHTDDHTAEQMNRRVEITVR